MTFAYIKLVSQKTKLHPSFGYSEMLELSLINRVLNQERVIKDVTLLLAEFSKYSSLSAGLLAPLTVYFLFFCTFPPFFLFFFSLLLFDRVILFLFFVRAAWATVVGYKVFHYLNSTIWFLFKNLLTSKLAFLDSEIIN